MYYLSIITKGYKKIIVKSLNRESICKFRIRINSIYTDKTYSIKFYEILS